VEAIVPYLLVIPALIGSSKTLGVQVGEKLVMSDLQLLLTLVISLTKLIIHPYEYDLKSYIKA